MSCRASELESLESEESVAAPGPLPAPRSPEPRVPVPEPGLDLSLSPPPASPERRKGRAERRGPAGRQVRFRLEPSELEAPSVHSSLGLGLELRAARVAAGGRFDAARAVEEQLRTSFQARCALEESVAEGLNVPRSKRLFRDLVSLRVPEEQVLDAALRDKLSLLPPPHARAPPPKEPPAPGPDMTVLCDPRTLCYEPPHLAVDGLPPLRLQARARPSEDTFLMHRTLRRWEA